MLTVLRFILVPIFGYYLYKQDYLASVILFTVSGVTDVLDGYIARKYNLVTSWGKIADPLADKLTQVTALVFLAINQIIPLFVVIIVMAKELLIGVGSLLLYKKSNFIVSANWYGKLATVIFYFSVVLIIVMKLFNKEEIYINILVGMSIFAALFAFFRYCLEYLKIRKL